MCPTHHWVGNAIKKCENRAAITRGLYKADGEGSSDGADAQLEPFCGRPGCSVNFFAAVPHTHYMFSYHSTAVMPGALRQPDPSTNPIVFFDARTMKKIKGKTNTTRFFSRHPRGYYRCHDLVISCLNAKSELIFLGLLHHALLIHSQHK